MISFSPNVPLGLCLLLLFHGCLAQLPPLRKQPQSPSLHERSECQIDRITAREPNRVLISEAGVSEFWDSFENDELQCAGIEAVRHTIFPKGLLLPYYPSAPELAYIIQGRGLQGTVLPGCPETFETSFASEGGREEFSDKHQRVYRYNEGDILALPAGTVHWTYNDGDRPIIAIVLRDISNVANQLDSNFRKFFLAGNPQSQQMQQGGHWGQPGQRPSWQKPDQQWPTESQQGPSWQQPGQQKQSESQHGSSWRPGHQGSSGSKQGPSWQQPGQQVPSRQQPGQQDPSRSHQGPSSQEPWGSTTRPSGQPGERQPSGQPWGSTTRPSGQPGQEGYNIFGGFGNTILEEIFKVGSDTIRKLQGANDDRGLIVQAENFQVLVPGEPEQEKSSRGGSGRTNGIDQTLCSIQLSANIASPVHADVYNPRGGRISSLNSHKLPVLNSLQLSAERGVLYKNAVLAPHYNLNAHSIIYITSGSSRLQIVSNNGSSVFDDIVTEGQLIVVPQNFAVIKKAGEEGCEWVAFKTNDNAITTQLAGRFSFISALPEEVLANSYDISLEQAKSLKYNRQEGVVLSPRSESTIKKAKYTLLNALFG